MDHITNIVKILFSVLIVLFCVSCLEYYSKEKIIGTYTAKYFKNNYDTIEIKPNGRYYRRVYDKNKKLLLNTNSTWELQNLDHQIYFFDFYLNFDDDLLKFPDNVKDIGGLQVSLHTKSGTIYFWTGYYENDYCYYKIK
jgi:hypothetical protein